MIISTANSTDGGSEDLTVNGTADVGGAAAIAWNSANNLTLTGGNSINLHAGSSIANLGAGGLTLNSGGAIALGGTINLAGTLTLNNGGLASGSGITANTLLLQGAGNVGASGTGNALNTTATTLTDSKSGGDAYVSQTGALNVDGTTTGAGLLNVSGNAGITIDAPLNLHNGAEAGDSLTLKAGGIIAVNQNVTAASVDAESSQTAGDAINFAVGPVVVAAAAQKYVATGAGADVNFANALLEKSAGVQPDSFEWDQGASISAPPALTLFSGGLVPGAYTLDSLSGNVTIPTGAGNLVANSVLTLKAPAGTVSINDNLSLSSLAVSGTAIQLNGTGGSETVTTSGGDQNYTAPVTLGAATTLNSGTIELAGVTGGANNLTLNNSGVATLNGAVSGVGTLTANGTGTLLVNNNVTAANVSDSEGTTLNGTGGSETVTTSGGDQNYTAQVTLGAATTLNSGTVELAGVTSGGNNLTLNNSGVATLNGAVSGTGTLTANGAGTLQVKNNITEGNVSDSEATTLNGTGGSETVATTGGDQNYTAPVTLGAATTLNSGTIELAGVTGGANNLTLNNSGVATLNGAVSGVGTLTANGTGTLLVNNNVTAANVSDSEGTTLNGTGGSETVTTSGGDQNYTAPVTLGSATTLNSGTVELAGVNGGGNNLTLNNSGVATLNGAVSGTGTLTANGAGTLQVNNNITEGNVSDSEGTTFNGTGGSETVTTTGGDQNYTAQVALGAATTLKSGTIELAGVTGGANNLTLNNSGVATLNGAVSGTGTLTANGAGTLQINNNITEGNVSDSEGTTFNGTGGSETVTTTGGDQNYTAQVALGAATTLKSGTIELAGVTGGGNNLTLNNSGVATLNGAVSGTGTLTANGAGTLQVNNNITEGNVSDSEGTTLNGTGGTETVTTTGGDQNYTAQVTLGAAVTLNSGTVELAGVAGGGNNLKLNNSGVATLNGAVSGTGTLTANGAGTLQVNNNITEGNVNDREGTTLNGTGGAETVTTTGGDQNYTAQVTLGAATTLNSGTIELIGGVSFTGDTLTLNNSGQATFGGTFSAFNLLSFNGPMALGANTVLDGTAYSLPAVAGNAFNLTLNNSGLAQLNGVVNGTGTLTANGAGALQVNNNITGGSVSDSEATTLNGTGGSETVTTTGGDQNYTAQVTLGAATTLNAGTIELAGVNGGANNLTLNNSGVATLNGAVSGTGTLSASGAGALEVNNNITGGNVSDRESTTLNGTGGSEMVTTTGGDQNYTAQVTLGAATTLNAGTIELAGVTGGANNLRLNNSGLAKLNGAVSGTGTLTANGAGALQVGNNITEGNVNDSESTTLNGTGGSETVTTTGGDQNYTAQVTLGAATTLSSGTIELVGVTGGGNNLALDNSGLAKLNGAISGAGTLTANGTGALQVNNNLAAGNINDNEGTTLNGAGGSEVVTTTGSQAYNGAVVQGANAHLTGGSLAVGSTWDAQNHDLELTFGSSVKVPAFANVVNFTSDGTGGTTINGTFATSGNQTYNNVVTLGRSSTLQGVNITFGSSVAGGGQDLTLNNSGAATLSSSGATGLGLLTIGTPPAGGGGTMQLNGSIRGNSVVDWENTTFAEPTSTLTSPTVATTGKQTYNGPLTLGANTYLAGSPLPTINNSVNANGYSLILEFLTGGRIFDSNLAADEDERRILGSIAPRVKKGQVKIITPFPGKRVIKEPGYLKGSSDVPLEPGTETYSLYSTLVD